MDLNPPGADCLSDYALDMLRAGLLPADAAAEVQGHVDGCADCAARFEAMRVGFDGEPDIDPRALLAGARRRAAARPRPWWSRIQLWLPALAVAAVAAFFVLRPGPGPGPDGPIRTKGGLALHVMRATAAGSEEVVSGARFAAGDRLRFAVDLPDPGYVAVIGVEAGGASYPAWPLGAADQKRPAGEGQLLDGALGLDAAPGRETLHLVLCPESPPACTVADGALRCPEGCRSTPFELDKGP